MLRSMGSNKQVMTKSDGFPCPKSPASTVNSTSTSKRRNSRSRSLTRKSEAGKKGGSTSIADWMHSPRSQCTETTSGLSSVASDLTSKASFRLEDMMEDTGPTYKCPVPRVSDIGEKKRRSRAKSCPRSAALNDSSMWSSSPSLNFNMSTTSSSASSRSGSTTSSSSSSGKKAPPRRSSSLRMTPAATKRSMWASSPSLGLDPTRMDDDDDDDDNCTFRQDGADDWWKSSHSTQKKTSTSASPKTSKSQAGSIKTPSSTRKKRILVRAGADGKLSADDESQLTPQVKAAMRRWTSEHSREEIESLVNQQNSHARIKVRASGISNKFGSEHSAVTSNSAAVQAMAEAVGTAPTTPGKGRRISLRKVSASDDESSPMPKSPGRRSSRGRSKSRSRRGSSRSRGSASTADNESVEGMASTGAVVQLQKSNSMSSEKNTKSRSKSRRRSSSKQSDADDDDDCSRHRHRSKSRSKKSKSSSGEEDGRGRHRSRGTTYVCRNCGHRSMEPESRDRSRSRRRSSSSKSKSRSSSKKHRSKRAPRAPDSPAKSTASGSRAFSLTMTNMPSDLLGGSDSSSLALEGEEDFGVGTRLPAEEEIDTETKLRNEAAALGLSEEQLRLLRSKLV